MRVVSVTMCRRLDDPLLADALASVAGLVDESYVHAFGEVEDFGAARNSLLLRPLIGPDDDWAIMLDVDERILWADDVADALKATDADVLMVPHVSGTYEKERIFRLPARGHYRGRTHEAFILDAGATRETLRGITFDEIAKTPEQYRAKVERDLPLLKAMTEEDPKDPRWWYYLGDTYSGLGKVDLAITAFERCWSLNGWDEESAWAAYRVAEIRTGQNAMGLAIDWCAKGMARHPGMAELPWLAGWCCYQMGQYRKAIWWEMMALSLNTMRADRHRIGFRYPMALAEGPADVLRFAYRALGEDESASRAHLVFDDAVAERQEREKIAAP